MAQKSWNGFLRMSLVSCPVSLSLATEENELTDNEHKAFEAMASKVIDLDHFVSRTEIDPLYLNTSYYVQADGELAIDSLRVVAEKMAAQGLAAIGRVTLGNRKRLVMFEPRGAGMVMYTLHNADEVRAPEFDTKRQENIDPEMLDITDTIIERRKTAFDPAGLLNKP
ncbi:MAG TPA: Ku protein [Stellaceae bacterium]|nr:Ku protein [Stellaceae bacterium]